MVTPSADMYHKDHQKMMTMCSLALGTSILSLFISLLSFAKAKENLPTTLMTTSPSPVATTMVSPQGLVSSPSPNPFWGIRRNVVTFSQTTSDSISQQHFLAALSSFRTAIASASANASAEVQQDLRELDSSLQSIETEARQDLAAGLKSFRELVQGLEKDILEDEKNQPFN